MSNPYGTGSSQSTYSSTDQLNNFIDVTVNGNVITVLDQEYILSNPVLFKQPTNLPNTLVYVTAVNAGMMMEAVQLVANVGSDNVVSVIVTYNRYYYLQSQQTPLEFPATQVSVNNGNMTAILNTAEMDTSQYNGQNLSLTGNVLTAQTVLTGTPYTSVTEPTSSGS